MHFLSRAYINIIYVDARVVLCEEGNSENFHFPCVRPHIEYSVQIYNKKIELCECTATFLHKN